MAILERIPDRRPIIDLKGPQGNAFCLIGLGKQYIRQLRENGIWVSDHDEVQIMLDEEQFEKDATSGDYENLIETFDAYLGEWVDLVR